MGTTFVGREAERSTLERALDAAMDGSGGIVLVTGEPGIGKTALCEQVAEAAAARGTLVRWGRSPEDTGAPPFWPWSRVLGSWPEDDAAADRFALFESRAAAVIDLAAPSGLLVLLDDLQWADEGSLRLLEHVAPSLHDSRVLIVANYRDDVARGSELERAIGSLARAATVIHLRGLDERGVAAVASAALGSELPAPAAHAVADHTDGNPFFVTQVVRLLESEGGVARMPPAGLGVPHGVREVIRRRLDRLDPGTGAVLSTAAAVGREFDLAMVDSAVDGFDVSKALDAAVDAGLLVTERSRPGRFRFVHALVREVLENDRGLSESASLHRRLLEILEQTSDRSPEALAALAFHALEAAPVIGAARVAPYVVDAAQAAFDAAGLEEALRLAETALAMASLDGVDRYGLLVTLGRACFALDDLERSNLVLLEAAALAERSGDAVRMARALLEIGSGRLVAPLPPAFPERLRAAIALVAGEHPALHADLLSRYGDTQVDPRRAERACRDALDIARGAGEADTLVRVATRLLLNAACLMTPAERRDVVDELLAIEGQVETRDSMANVRAIETRVLLEEGRLDDALLTARSANALFERLPMTLHVDEPVQILVALLRGDLARAETLTVALMAETARRGAERSIGPSNSVRMLMLMWERGLGTTIAAMVDGTRSDPSMQVDTTVLDLAYAGAMAETDDIDTARHAVDVALGHDLERAALGWAGLAMGFTCMVVETAARTAHEDACARLAPIVEFVSDRNVVMGMAPAIALGWGSYFLGLCRLVQGRLDEAMRLLEEARHQNETMGALAPLARCHLALADVELERGDGTAALDHLRRAQEISDRSDLPSVRRRAQARLERMGLPQGGEDFGTTTFVFTDIVGSTERTAVLGDREWRALLDEHTSSVRALVARHEGRIVKGLGDGHMLTFGSARAGIEFALALQRNTAERPLPVRVGVHTGEAEVVDGDHIGHHVNLAARIAGEAGPGEVLVSDVVHVIVASAGDVEFGAPRVVSLKGIPGEQRLHPVVVAPAISR